MNKLFLRMLIALALPSMTYAGDRVGVFGIPQSGVAPSTGWSCPAELVDQNLVISPEYSPANFAKYNFSSTSMFSMNAVVRPAAAAHGSVFTILAKSERCDAMFAGGAISGEDWALELHAADVGGEVVFLPVLRVKGTSGSIQFVSTAAIEANRWSTIQFAFDNRVDPPIVMLGANGQIIDAAIGLGAGVMPQRSAPVGSSRRIWIGVNPAHPQGGMAGYRGEIAEISIWNRARQVAEMSACDARSNPPNNDPNLIGYYRFGNPVVLGGRTVSADAFLATAANAVLGTTGMANRTFPSTVTVNDLPILRQITLAPVQRPAMNEFVITAQIDANFEGEFQWSGFINQAWVPLSDGMTVNGSIISGSSQPQLRVVLRDMQDAVLVRARAFYPGCNDSRAKVTPTYQLYCEADYNGDGVINYFDVLDLVADYSRNRPQADINHDGVIDFFDYLDILDSQSRGC